MKPGFCATFAKLTLGLFLLTASAYGEAPEEPGASQEENIYEFSDPELFWQEVIVGNITKIISHDPNEIIFEFDDNGSTVKGRIDKNLIEDREVKTKGSKKAVNILIMRLEEVPLPAAENEKRFSETDKRLRNLTGQNFEKPGDWREWYEENKGSLVWSDQKNRLIIKEKTD